MLYLSFQLLQILLFSEGFLSTLDFSQNLSRLFGCVYYYMDNI